MHKWSLLFEKIIFIGLVVSSLTYTHLKFVHRSPDAKLFYESFGFHKFRVLKEVQVTGCNWPTTTRREISNDWWHRSSDALLKRGIKLTDESGIHWSPRLGCCWRKWSIVLTAAFVLLCGLDWRRQRPFLSCWFFHVPLSFCHCPWCSCRACNSR